MKPERRELDLDVYQPVTFLTPEDIGENDAEEIGALRRIVNPDVAPLTNQGLMSEIRKHESVFAICVVRLVGERTIVGTGAVSRIITGGTGSTAVVHYIVTSPKHVNKGIATAMVERLEYMARVRWNSKRIEISCPADRQERVSLYELLGYAIQKKVIMEKSLEKKPKES